MPTYFDEKILASIIRYLIKAAQDKRVVPYHELENVFGLSHNMVAVYAGQVGDFCGDKKMPLLNAMIINTTTCTPSEGFGPYLPKGKDWGQALADCWSHFHQTTSRKHQVENFSGLGKTARDWAQGRGLIMA